MTVNLSRIKFVILCVALALGLPARATPEDCENQLIPPAALAVAERIQTLMHHAGPANVTDAAIALVAQFVRDDETGTPADVERALRHRDGTGYLLGVHRDHLDNPRLRIVDPRDGSARDHYLHFAGSGADEAARRRRDFAIGDARANLEALRTSGVLTLADDPAAIARDVAEFVAALDRRIANAVPPADVAAARVVNAVVTDEVLRYLARSVDVSAATLEAEFRRVASSIHLIAVSPRVFGPRVHVDPIDGRAPTAAPYVLQTLVADGAQRSDVFRMMGIESAQNLVRLNDVGIIADGERPAPTLN